MNENYNISKEQSMLELLFILSFTLHNIEEGLWLPKWSQHAEKYHQKVSNNEFHFALISITVFGYLLTFALIMFGSTFDIIRYIYLGFIIMMSFNAIFPHLLATIALKKYAPGTLTGLLLNLPIGIAIVIQYYRQGLNFFNLIIATVIVAFVVIISLKPLFKLGKLLIEEY